MERGAILDGTPPEHDGVVKDTVLLGPDTLPAASRAVTLRAYGVLHASPLTVADVGAGVPVTDVTTVVALRTSYAVTPMLSVEAVQVRLMLLPEGREPARLADV